MAATEDGVVLEVDKTDEFGEDEEGKRDWKGQNGQNGNNEDAHLTPEEREQKRIMDEARKKEEDACLERCKLEIGGLPKNYPLGQLKKLLNNTLQLDVCRLKPGGLGRNVAYCAFKSDEARSKAMLVIEGYKWQSGNLTCKHADYRSDPTLLSKIDFLKVPKKEHESLPVADRVKKAVTPMCDMSYDEQLKSKEKQALSTMRRFGSELSQLNEELYDFVMWHKRRRKGQICEMADIIPSPSEHGYRNKCEFTIGMNHETEKPCVGFRVASYSKGSVEVGPVSHLTHINEAMKNSCMVMEEYVTQSPYAPYDPFTQSGVWRQLTVRTTNNADLLMVVVIHPQEMDQDTIQYIKQDVVFYFTEGEGKRANATAIYFQQYGQLESGVPVEYEHLWGKNYIEETICGKSFRAAPDAFLQVNTPACEILYNTVGELLDIDSTTCLLDICCGVGTIGLSLADSCYKVIGVDSVPDAIENARINANANGLGNAVFYSGTAEAYIDRMLERAEKNDTVAVVDPPRAGLNGSVMNAIRKCEYVNRLVYISCDLQGALANFQALCRPKSKNYKGSYFVPIKAVPIDMFPGTNHFEMAILFERYDECKWERIMSGNPRPKDQAYFDRVPVLKYDEEEERRKEANEKVRASKEERKRAYLLAVEKYLEKDQPVAKRAKTEDNVEDKDEENNITKERIEDIDQVSQLETDVTELKSEDGHKNSNKQEDDSPQMPDKSQHISKDKDYSKEQTDCQ